MAKNTTFEKEHPRGQPDNKGQFVRKGAQGDDTSEVVSDDNRAKEIVRRHEQRTGESVEQEIARKEKEHVPPALGFADKTRRDTHHHREHAKEMRYKNQHEYERAGCNFFNSNRGKLYYSIKRKRFYRYDEKTGELAVSSDGILHTYMRQSKKEFQKDIKREQLYE